MFGFCTRDLAVEDIFSQGLGTSGNSASCCRGLVIYIIISAWNVGVRKFLAIWYDALCWYQLKVKYHEIHWKFICVLLCFPQGSAKEIWLRHCSLLEVDLLPPRCVCYSECGCCLSIAPQHWSVVVWLQCCSFVPIAVPFTGVAVGASMSSPVFRPYSTFF